ncbi:SRPBCC domain-containing protein [Blastomonas sp. AAP53]|uniref:SRPBCC domain-containing protein n=1 Tax=Blastomonas sp. AAP53 TaxID=1248760 RepID=UPI000477967C|nr:SRPBCC domain-containing protein [Blastomonas sp. AAP53]
MPAEQISVVTTVPVAPERAWALYTDADAVTRWNFASDDWQCPSASIDLRVGGTHVARMEAKDGSFGFDFTGTYEEVDMPRSLTLRLDDGRKSRTTFAPSDGGTTVETTFDADDAAPVEMQRDGWQAILNNYGKLVAQMSQG